MTVPFHPLVADYATRHGLSEGMRADGRLTILIDDKYRVHLQGAHNGWLVIYARLCSLPSSGRAREDFLADIGRQAAGMLNRHASACVIDPAEDGLWLQQMLRPDTDALGVDEAVGDFANALSYWTGATRRAL
ncbi:CesT family type III secretion system chaperone [Yanghanlia caeni]|uniref:CesT family type III secretion system chaperone n=1 Tax=Yanghanlia caeni TaxID=3064283 RepID=A0ABU1D8F3_9BURK|nr:CesT family type III secretion system chaperone [Alcaligenaceae bacterium LG-2]